MTLQNIITVTNTAAVKLTNILQQSNKSAIRFYVKIDNIEIHVCNKSLIHLLGTNIDWTEDIMGQGFTFQNPMAQASCGCGTSFSSKAFN
jgi:Fe-S cluster assembly iron-binding protein IscA